MRRWLSDAVLIAAAPLLGYLVAFLNEFGYLHYFGVPYDLISVSITDVFIALGFVGIVVGWVLYTELGWPLLPQWIALGKSSDPLSIRKTKTYPLFISALLSLAFFVFFGWWQLTALVTLSYLLWMAYLYGWPVLRSGRATRRQPRSLSYHDKLLLQHEREMKAQNINYVLTRSIEIGLFIPLMSLVLLLASAYLVGVARARAQESFLVPLDRPNVVVLRIYGDSIVGVELCRTQHKVGDSLVLEKIAGRPITLRHEHLGRLDRSHECRAVLRPPRSHSDG